MATKPQLVAEYPYRDTAGDTIAVKCRFEPGFDGRPKSFSWRRPLPPDLRTALHIPRQAQAWVKGLAAGWYAPTVGRDGTWWFKPTEPHTTQAVELPETDVHMLYRLPELCAGDMRATVFLLESEKDVHMLDQLGLIATCAPCGVGHWNHHYAVQLTGRRVLVVADDSPTAIQAAHWKIGSLIAAGVQSVRLLTPNASYKSYKPPPGKGLGNWLDTIPPNQQRQAVIETCSRLLEWVPKSI